MKPRIAVSIGDLNGIGAAIALLAHKALCEKCTPLYCISDQMLEQASALLRMERPPDFSTVAVGTPFEIAPGVVSADSGRYAYESFLKAIEMAENGDADAVVTLPIHKEAWAKAGLHYVGHTDLLREHFKAEAIMMLGCSKMYVALYTEHIPLASVPEAIDERKLTQFLLDLHRETGADKIGVLGLNPHAGDNGVLGSEERIIERAIEGANGTVGKPVFEGPLVPDIAFTPHTRKQYTHYAAMYHDQGLAPLKALYFDESINVSLNLPVIRTSVDHGTAFDIAYSRLPSTRSYLNAADEALRLIALRRHRAISSSVF
jgi:4-hydroxythreonine-4-phosphate dehydrogenase